MLACSGTLARKYAPPKHRDDFGPLISAQNSLDCESTQDIPTHGAHGQRYCSMKLWDTKILYGDTLC